jgi:Putative lumazine-binding
MATTITDTEQITAAIEGYVRGCQTGDRKYLEDAFHADARMFGAVGSDRYDLPIFGGMDNAVAENPTVDHTWEILAMDVTGDAASVKISESRFWGQDFVDYFLLSRIKGEWQIVAKAFAHIGASA